MAKASWEVKKGRGWKKRGMKHLKFSFSLLVHNKIKYFGFEPSISKMGYMYCALEAEGSNGVEVSTLSEDKLLKVGRLQYRLLCFKAIKRPRIFV